MGQPLGGRCPATRSDIMTGNKGVLVKGHVTANSLYVQVRFNISVITYNFKVAKQ